MALKQKRRFIQTSKVVNSVPSILSSKLVQEDNTHCIPVEANDVLEITCCTSCLEVEYINENAEVSTSNNCTVISPILTRAAVPEVTYPSPVLNKYKCEETKSPVLTRTCISSSPVIGNYSFRKRAKLSRTTKFNATTIESSSPDIFLTQGSAVHINNDDDDDSREQSPSPIKISQICSQNVEKCNTIELIDSEDEIKNYQVFSSSKSLSSSSYSYSINSEFISSASDNNTGTVCTKVFKRKRYKKKGLAKQLQKCITYKNSSVAMWLHEQQFNKYHTDCDATHTHILRIKEFWEDCGNFVLYCDYVLNKDNNDFCFVIISINNIISFVPYTNAKFYLYPPYITKVVEYNSKCLKCFCNTFRIKLYESKNE